MILSLGFFKEVKAPYLKLKGYLFVFISWTGDSSDPQVHSLTIYLQHFINKNIETVLTDNTMHFSILS